MGNGLRAAERRLDCEALEDRAVPAFAYSLSGASLLAFDTGAPDAATAVPVTGVGAGESLVGLDFAPDGTLHALGVNADANAATLYGINVQTGEASAVGAPGAVKFASPTGGPVDLPDPDATEYALDFDPATGDLRVVTAGGLNFRVGSTGAPIDGDGGLAGAVGGVNPDGAINALPAGSTGVGASAYGPNPAQPGASRLYTLDAGSNKLLIQSPNSGTQSQALGLTLDGAPLDFSAAKGFDISAEGGAVAALTVGATTRLYSLDLATGAAAELGAAPVGASGLAMAPSGGVIEFASAAFVTSEGGPAAEITLTRTGGTHGEVSVTVTPTDGTATAGSDFAPGPYVVTFAPGQDTATLLLLLPPDAEPEADETLTLALSAPTGGAALGAQASATLTITDGSGVPVPLPTPVAPPSGIAVGAGVGAGAVNVFNADGSLRHAFLPYGETMRAGVRVASGDLTGDGVDDVITAPALGAPHVKVFDGATGAELRSFFAFDPGFAGGLSVAAGDVDGDGLSDIIVGTANGSSHVKVFSGATGGELASFFAHAPGFTGGVNVAAGDVNGDGLADIVTGTATGPSHVKVFAGGSLAVLQSAYAFIGHTGGVSVAAGDLDGDGKAEVAAGTAAGFSHVKLYDGATGGEVGSFFAFPGHTRGVNVAARDTDGDGLAELLAGTAADAAHVKGFDGLTAVEVNSFLAFGAGFRGGVFVA